VAVTVCDYVECFAVFRSVIGRQSKSLPWMGGTAAYVRDLFDVVWVLYQFA
jgi:hypothetical protein